MTLRPASRGILPGLLVAWLAVIPWLSGQNAAPGTFSDLRAIYDATLAKINDAAKAQRAAQDASYLDVLSKLAAKFQAAGDLDNALKVAEERKAVTETGKAGTGSDPNLDPARKTYSQAREASEKQTHTKLAELNTAYEARLQALEVSLTKAGKLDDAVEVRNERQRIQASMTASAPVPPPAPKPDDAPKADPGGDPPLATGNPFKQAVWTTPFTVPVGRYHLLLNKWEVKIPDKRPGGAPEVVFPKGTTLSGSKEITLFFGRSHFEARESEFIDMRMRGDLNSRGIFQGCTLRNCTVGKGGGWFGGNFASKWKFEKCTIEKSFIESFKVWDVGLCLTDSTVQNAELPSLQWNDKEDDSMILSDWLQVRRTRFEHCKIPLSFLMITDACSFVNCTYIEDYPSVPLTKPLTVHLYEDGATSRITHLPPNLLLREHPLSELPRT